MSDVQELVMLVKAAHREIERGDNALLRPLGLTGGQADALVAIARREPVSLRDLGSVLIAESGHPSRLVDRLVSAGCVERRASADDRRRIELSLTPRGRDLERDVSRLRSEAMRRVDAALGDQDLEPILRLLRQTLSGSELSAVIARRLELLAEEPRA